MMKKEGRYREQHIQKKFSPPQWQRLTLLVVLGYEAAGCLLGGVLLVAAPDGSIMDMPVGIMHGAFEDFLVPGILLFLLGILNTAAFVTVFRRRRSDWIMAGLALGGLFIWFDVEIIILQELHWLHAMWGLPVSAIFSTSKAEFSAFDGEYFSRYCGSSLDRNYQRYKTAQIAL